MEPTMRHLLSLVLLTLSLHAQAAVTVDLNLDRLRQAPEAADVQARLEAILPREAQERLAALSEHFGCDPRRDLRRVVVSIPDQGAPTVRLVGLPAERIAEALAMQGEYRDVLGGMTGFPLPNRPQALLVALGPSEMLIGRADLLAKETTAPPSLPPVDPALGLRLRLTPAAVPRAEVMKLVSSIELTSNGMGALDLVAVANNPADGMELQKRYEALREVSTSAAAEFLPGLHRLGRLMAVTTLDRQGDQFHLHAEVPADLRRDGIDRLLDRLQQRAAQR
jgi:hypothetical protein